MRNSPSIHPYASDGILARTTSGSLLRAGLFGLEREALRVTPQGELAQTPHPWEFGDKLETSPITVDFSESQVELVTTPQGSVESALGELQAIQARVESVLAAKGERLWPLSMPPALPDESAIPIARFDDSPKGRRRELYRRGLASRYGRRMQVISGIHFSFSFAPALIALLGKHEGAATGRAFTDSLYLRLARNVLRYRWLPLLLTGASPVADASFTSAAASHARHATSLRMSRLGYSDTARESRLVSFDSLSEYTRDLRRLLFTRSPRYARLAPLKADEPMQLNDRILQLENEFYSPIRLKGGLRGDEGHLNALEREGVAYAEFRILDINPFTPAGIDLDTLRFLQLFMLDCLLSDSPPLDAAEWSRLQENHNRVALSGRLPGLLLCNAEGFESPLAVLAEEHFRRLQTLAHLMDREASDAAFTRALSRLQRRISNPGILPSARLMSALQATGTGFAGLGRILLQGFAPELDFETAQLAI